MTGIHSDSTDKLFQAILSLRDEEECYKFFEDLCTIGEIQAISQRFAVATMLNKGEKHSKIAKETGASSATISRVNRWLHYGSGGYQLVLERERTK